MLLTVCFCRIVFGRPFVKRFALCYRSVVCLFCLSCPSCPVCLSVCNVGVLWPNGWMDQDATWYRCRSPPRPHCVRWGLSSPSQKGHSPPPPIFGPRMLWPNSWLDQDATWYGGRPRRQCVRWEPIPQKGTASPHFGQSIFAKRMDRSRCHLIQR